MNYEVELKYRLEDEASVVDWLTARAAERQPIQQHCDAYFNHPERDFARTDEAFRIRSSGEQNRLTYKGPLIDRQTKTRREIEVGCESGIKGCEKLRQLLVALGFREVRSVVKQRTPYHLNWHGHSVEVTLDEVHELGTFVELETIAGEHDWETARDALLELAAEMGLQNSERRSYLQLLLEA